MGFKIKNIVLPSGINKKSTTIALLIVAIISGAIFYFIANGDAMPSNASGEKEKILINDDANSSTINKIVGTKGVVESSVTTPANNNASQPIIMVNGVNKLNSSTPTPTEFDIAAKKMAEQAKIKKLQNSYDALNSKASVGSGTAKSNASQTVGGNLAMANPSANSESSNNPSSKNVAVSDSELLAPKSPYMLQATAIIPAVMISGINSQISGTVSAQVRENVYDSISGQYLLIPQGSRLVGTFNNGVAYGDNRLAVAWQRVIYPNGYSADLKAIQGSDVAGFNGFYDQVDNHYWQLFGTSFVMGVITAGMQYSQNNTNQVVATGGIGITNPNPSVGQTVSGSLGQQLGQTSMMVAQKSLNIAPTITVRQGYKFTIMLTADIVLKPYKQD